MPAAKSQTATNKTDIKKHIKDERTHQRIKEHLKNEQNSISEEDILNAKTDGLDSVDQLSSSK